MMHLPDIPPIDEKALAAVQARQAQLVKPKGALGELEALSVRLAGMTGHLDWLPRQKAVIVCAGDHGVVAQGVSTVPSSVTAFMVGHFLNGTAAISVLARQMDARLMVVDAGVAAELEDHPQLVRGKVALGTADLNHGPAMTPEQAEQSVQLGIDVAGREFERGLDLLAVGEMGIGNTTAASALISAITGRNPAEVTGRGTGLDAAAFQHKICVIEQSLRVNEPVDENPLAKVGGFEIGAMAGLMIGAASARIPVVIDGLICTAAALIAARLQPDVKHYLIAGHRSLEPGHQIALEWLGLRPLLDLEMRLGEGTGAVLAMPIIEAAMRTLQEMATFGD
jgi:nicotinate-nucleotide--dimethylbenzimidazole phosphoribosyltransferase